MGQRGLWEPVQILVLWLGSCVTQTSHPTCLCLPLLPHKTGSSGSSLLESLWGRTEWMHSALTEVTFQPRAWPLSPPFPSFLACCIPLGGSGYPSLCRISPRGSGGRPRQVCGADPLPGRPGLPWSSPSHWGPVVSECGGWTPEVLPPRSASSRRQLHASG